MSCPNALARRLAALIARIRADTRGTTAIEFALVALPFFAVLIAIFEIGIVYLAQNELETAVEKSARQLLTGKVQQGGISQSQFANKVCSYLPALFSCSGIMVDVQTASSFATADTSMPTLSFNASGNVTNTWNYNTGGADSILVLRVLYQFPVVPGPLHFNLSNLVNGYRLLMATSVFEVEPYSGGGN